MSEKFVVLPAATHSCPRLCRGHGRRESETEAYGAREMQSTLRRLEPLFLPAVYMGALSARIIATTNEFETRKKRVYSSFLGEACAHNGASKGCRQNEREGKSVETLRRPAPTYFLTGRLSLESRRRPTGARARPWRGGGRECRVERAAGARRLHYDVAAIQNGIRTRDRSNAAATALVARGLWGPTTRVACSGARLRGLLGGR